MVYCYPSKVRLGNWMVGERKVGEEGEREKKGGDEREGRGHDMKGQK